MGSAGRISAALAPLIREYYVFPNKVDQVADAVVRWSEDRESDVVTAMETGAELTSLLRQASNDWHFSVQARRFSAEEEAAAPEDRWKHVMPGSEDNYGFRAVEVVDGVAVVTITSLVPLPWSRSTAEAAMSLIRHANSVVIDLCRCGGGDPDLIALLAGYFLGPESVELSSVRWRDNGRIDALHTSPDGAGFVFGAEVPLFIAVGPRTASGAEALAYDLKAYGRATIVGTPTLGAAHRIKQFALDDALIATIPCGKVTNLVTGSDWQGAGVQPNILAGNGDDDARRAAVAAARVVLGP